MVVSSFDRCTKDKSAFQAPVGRGEYQKETCLANVDPSFFRANSSHGMYTDGIMALSTTMNEDQMDG